MPALSPSERVTTIREVAARLGEERWALIDLTLSQFGLPTSDRWDGSAFDYVLAMCRDADDVALVGLAEHCGYAAQKAPLGVDPPFWGDGSFRVFLSHISAHKVEVGHLQTALSMYGVAAFVAHNDIEPSKEWQVQIETALATCDCLIALLHKDFHASKWTDQEIGFAMGRGLPIFTVQLGEVPYGFVGRFQAFAGVGKSALDLAREIFETLIKHKQTQRAIGPVVVRLFEDSSSFQDAKKNVALLEMLELWEPDFSERITKAAKMNSQIKESWGVPARVNLLVEKWAA